MRLWKIYHDLNKEYFDKKLKIKGISVTEPRSEEILAWYDPKREQILFCPTAILMGEENVKETMYHEMAHRYCHQLGVRSRFWNSHIGFFQDTLLRYEV